MQSQNTSPRLIANGVRPGVLPFKFWADDRGAIRFAEAQWDRVAKRAVNYRQPGPASLRVGIVDDITGRIILSSGNQKQF
jgi:hypothetical protein